MQSETDIVLREPEKIALVQVDWSKSGPNPQSMEQTIRVANVLMRAGLCNSSLKTLEQYACVIWAGQAVNVPPIQSCMGIALINGRPTIWGDLAVALALRSGKLDGKREWFDGDGKNLTAHYWTSRNGVELESVFSWKDAEVAGLAGKDTYRKFPRDMLMSKAKARNLRAQFADVLGGMDVSEEPRLAGSGNAPPVPSPELHAAILDGGGVPVPEPDPAKADLFAKEVGAAMTSQPAAAVSGGGGGLYDTTPASEADIDAALG